MICLLPCTNEQIIVIYFTDIGTYPVLRAPNTLSLKIAHAFNPAVVAMNTRILARTAAALWSSRPGLSTNFSTCDTVGVFLFRTFDLDMIYLWSVWYSLGDIVYLNAFRNMGSVVDFAVIRSRDGFAPSEAGITID